MQPGQYAQQEMEVSQSEPANQTYNFDFLGHATTTDDGARRLPSLRATIELLRFD